MIVNTGIDEFRDAIADRCNFGEGGTDNTAPVKTQTDLIAGVSATQAPLAITKSAGTFQTNFTIPGTVGTGQTYVEWKIARSTGTLISRSLTVAINHTTADDLTKLTTFVVQGE
jgi:hypothetical protein